ncbi:MAG TPA: hypothetical protein VGQ42_11950 [Candidatus Dormibacteraeota bacterium]|jgi:hypothetical protein|nr:hypothetical protein [Candidatus Dormibacteraeota bacterium]
MAQASKSFADLQRELITTQMERRRAAQKEAAASSWRTLTDDLACAPSSEELAPVKG